ncbi:MAG: hypothetical protein BMS9Abin07_0464 [Acidimicrobiia bacterium]|nr:MAG: hypothetical protein BMS9Abin07_0464 [Acidimicrobiia bacterium]
MSADSAESYPITRNQQRFASWMTDVLIYIVVLNLFVEFSEAIVIDSFTISIFTAVLLKAMLDVIGGVEHRVKAFFDQRDGTLWGALGAASLFGILFISKFIILEVVDIVFGDHVELGHLIDIIVLIVAMIAARLVFRKIYQRFGDEPLP